MQPRSHVFEQSFSLGFHFEGKELEALMMKDGGIRSAESLPLQTMSD